MTTKITLKKLNQVKLIIECMDRSIHQDLTEFFSFYADGYRHMKLYKEGLWDGKIRLYNSNKRILDIGLISYVETYCKQNDIELEVSPALYDYNDIEPSETVAYMKELDIRNKGDKINPYSYQYKGVHHAITKKRTCLLSSTSSGKSLILYGIAQYITEIEKKKTIIIVPTIDLVSQMANDFINYASEFNPNIKDNIHQITAGVTKQTDKLITITTWQSIQKCGEDYLSQFTGMIFDEAHLLNGKALQNIANNCTNAEYRIGATGTIKDAKANQLVIEGITGKVLEISNTKELMKSGKISKIKVDVKFLSYPDNIKKASTKLDYKSEMDAVSKYSKRLKYVVNLAIQQDYSGLVLFNSVEQGKQLYAQAIEQEPDRNIYLIYGGIPKEKREIIKKKMEADDNAILFATYGTLSTGISIKNIHYIIFASSSKSKIRVLQSIGRGLRLHKDKEYMTLYDIVDDLTWKAHKNFSIIHFEERQRYYNNAGFDYNIERVSFTNNTLF